MSEYTELKVRNEEYKRVYEELKQRFESEGIDFNNMTMRLKKAITARIYLETGLIEGN